MKNASLVICPVFFAFALVKLAAPAEEPLPHFVTDPGLRGGYEAFPVNVPSKGYRSAEFRVVDASPGAVPKTIALALTRPDGTVLTPGMDRAIASEQSGTQDAANGVVVTATITDARTQAATIRTREALGERRLVVLYNGANMSRFWHATLSVTLSTSSGPSTSRISLDSQLRIVSASQASPQPDAPGAVVASMTNNQYSYGTGTPFGPAHAGDDSVRWAGQSERGGYDPTADNNRLYVGRGRSVRMFTSAGVYTNTEIPVPGGAQVSVTGISSENLHGDPTRSMLYVVDQHCAACMTKRGTGITALACDISSGIGNDSLPGRVRALDALGAVDFRAASAGPRGVLATASNNSASAGSLFVAARNAIYRYELASDGFGFISGPTLVAGAGTPGARGTGYADARGREARFNFGDGEVEMATDTWRDPPHRLFVTDPGNRSIRSIDLRSGIVTTYAHFPAPPVGLSRNVFSGLLLVSIPSQDRLYAVVPNGEVRIVAGSPGSAADADGFGDEPYPLQFSRDCAICDESGKTSQQYAKLPLSANTELRASRARLSRPLSITFDAQSAGWAFIEADGSLRLAL